MGIEYKHDYIKIIYKIQCCSVDKNTELHEEVTENRILERYIKIKNKCFIYVFIIEI